MYEGCCCKEKSGNFLLHGQACSCILLSNAHASKKGCRSANLPLKNLVAWHVQCGGNDKFSADVCCCRGIGISGAVSIYIS